MHRKSFPEIVSQLGMLAIDAKALRSPSCLYSNNDLLSVSQAVDNYAYAIPTELESISDYSNSSATFYAERYGGAGIGKNGGAGRCGTQGNFQIKGIGRTALIDPCAAKSDFWHSHGGLSLPEAIQEAIWGEVFSIALPYGAARVASIIGTGTKCWYESTSGKRKTIGRALIVRESTVRPAHFMRAPYFRPNPDVKIENCANRVRRAIKNILDYLPPAPLNGRESDRERLTKGLEALVFRYAHQGATALSHRLMHGALYPSNLSMDGRWVDFGTSTLLPTYANTNSCGAPLNFATLWDEHRGVESVIESLCFYINKYYVFGRECSAISASNIAQFYRSTFDAALKMAAIRLLNIPAAILSGLSNSYELDALAETLVRLLKIGNQKRIDSAVRDLSVFGKNDIGIVISNLAQYSMSPSCDDRLIPLIESQALRGLIIKQFNGFIAALSCSGESKVSEEALRTICYVGGFKTNHSIPALYRYNIKKRTEEIAESVECNSDLKIQITNEILTVRQLAKTLFAPCVGLEITAWADKDGELCFNAQSGTWIFRNSNSMRILDAHEAWIELKKAYRLLPKLSKTNET